MVLVVGCTRFGVVPRDRAKHERTGGAGGGNERRTGQKSSP